MKTTFFFFPLGSTCYSSVPQWVKYLGFQSNLTFSAVFDLFLKNYAVNSVLRWSARALLFYGPPPTPRHNCLENLPASSVTVS